jgi:hypothetical protein
MQSGADDGNAANEGTWYYLGWLDANEGDKVPAASTQLTPWVVFTNTNNAALATHTLRVAMVDVA